MQNVTPISITPLNTHPENINKENNLAHLPKNESLTLDAVLAEVKQWRVQKAHPASPIPDTLWEKIFQLAHIHSPTKIRSLLNISTNQYQRKWEQKYSPSPETSTQSTTANLSIPPTTNSPELCAIKLKPSTYQSQPLPNAKTIVVEFYRTDGQRMSIHTTQDSISTLMQDFFKG